MHRPAVFFRESMGRSAIPPVKYAQTIVYSLLAMMDNSPEMPTAQLPPECARALFRGVVEWFRREADVVKRASGIMQCGC
jgi:hypothetical protein